VTWKPRASRGRSSPTPTPISAPGRRRLELVFEVTAAGAAQRYLAALFVYEGWLANTIRTVEFVAPKDLFERYAAGVRKSVATIR
jgi:hypothetical protein